MTVISRTIRLGVVKLGALIQSATCGPAGRLILFGAVGLSGFVPNLAALAVLTDTLGLNYAIASVAATQVAICWNFVLLDRIVYRQSRTGAWYRRAGQFAALNNVDLVVRIPMLVVLVEVADIDYLAATVATLVTMFAVRFLATDWIVYRVPRVRVGRLHMRGGSAALAMIPAAALED